MKGEESERIKNTDLAGVMTFGVDGNDFGNIGDGSWTPFPLVWLFMSFNDTLSSGDLTIDTTTGLSMVDASFEFNVTFSICSFDCSDPDSFDSWHEISNVSRWQGEHIFSHKPIGSLAVGTWSLFGTNDGRSVDCSDFGESIDGSWGAGDGMIDGKIDWPRMDRRTGGKGIDVNDVIGVLNVTNRFGLTWSVLRHFNGMKRWTRKDKRREY